MKIGRRSAGLTLLETLFATMVMVIAVVAIIQFYLTSLNLSEINKDETLAMAHLVNMAEAIKCTPFNNLSVNFPDGVSDGPASNNYATIVGGYALKNEHISVSYVNTHSDPLEIKIGVNWQDKRGMNHTKYLVTKRTR